MTSSLVAKILFLFKRPKVSTSIAETTTYGYGKLDTLGYWQFMLWED